MKSQTTGEQVEVVNPSVESKSSVACKISQGFIKDSQGFVKDKIFDLFEIFK